MASAATARVSRCAAKLAAKRAFARALARLQLSHEAAAAQLDLSVSRVRLLVSERDEHRDVVPSAADLVCAGDGLLAAFLAELRAQRTPRPQEPVEAIATRALIAKSRTVALIGAALADGHVTGPELAEIASAAAHEETATSALLAMIGRAA